jgi:HPt (histidine-containing phosphotransfer) domain-containing protein
MAMPAYTHDGQERGRTGARRPREGERRHDTPIDWTHLSRFTLNDRALEQEVLGLFAMEAPHYLARMQTATSRQDWIEAAHTLKGSARAVGAWAIAECAQAAEALQLSARHELAGGPACTEADARAAHGAHQALERLNEAVHRTLTYIEQIRSSGVPKAASHPA